jgi:hypothetical protein
MGPLPVLWISATTNPDGFRVAGPFAQCFTHGDAVRA